MTHAAVTCTITVATVINALTDKTGGVSCESNLHSRTAALRSAAFFLPDRLPDKAATLLIYCRSGRRSRDAAEKLIALGYENVYDFGGINDWPYETVTQ